jgi:hypothetical protein
MTQGILSFVISNISKVFPLKLMITGLIIIALISTTSITIYSVDQIGPSISLEKKGEVDPTLLDTNGSHDQKPLLINPDVEPKVPSAGQDIKFSVSYHHPDDVPPDEIKLVIIPPFPTFAPTIYDLDSTEDHSVYQVFGTSLILEGGYLYQYYFYTKCGEQETRTNSRNLWVKSEA